LSFSLLFVCMILFWRASATAGDGQFHITFLEVGSADAVLIQTPEGRNILINGGASVTELSDELGRRLPFFSRKLDWLIIASTQEEQLAALPRVVEIYPPDNVLWSGNAQASFPAQTLDEYFRVKAFPSPARKRDKGSSWEKTPLSRSRQQVQEEAWFSSNMGVFAPCFPLVSARGCSRRSNLEMSLARWMCCCFRTRDMRRKSA
jgi:beta-lactamase superfamily II metal-dependent hydrolase